VGVPLIKAGGGTIIAGGLATTTGVGAPLGLKMMVGGSAALVGGICLCTLGFASGVRGVENFYRGINGQPPKPLNGQWLFDFIGEGLPR